jgi:hypothetical protein
MNHTKLKGTWRSYKAFCAHGGVKKYSAASFLELHKEEQGGLVVKLYADRPLLSEVPAHEWTIREEGRRHYLWLQGRRAFEVLTLDACDLVLADPAKGEKIFFAPLAEWNRRLNPALLDGDPNVSLTIWSKSLASVVKK